MYWWNNPRDPEPVQRFKNFFGCGLYLTNAERDTAFGMGALGFASVLAGRHMRNAFRSRG